MLNPIEFAKYLQDLFDNDTDLASVSTEALFSVRTPDLPFVDTIAQKVESSEDPQIHRYPVMVEQDPSGQYDPYPDLGTWDGAVTVTFLFPVALMPTMELYYDKLATKLSGKQACIGDITGTCVLAVGARGFGALQSLDVGQFSQISQQVMAVFGKETRVTREWITMSFRVDASGGIGEEDEVMTGNQFESVLSFKKPGSTTTFSEVLTRVDSSSALSAMAFSQQTIPNDETKSLNASKAYGDSVCCFVKNDNFWRNIILGFKNNELDDWYWTYEVKVYNYLNGKKQLFGNLVSYDKALISDIAFSYGYGEGVTCSMTITRKGEVVDL